MRKLSPAQAAVVATREITALQSWEDFDQSSTRSIRETSPYRIGDVVPVEFCGKALIVAIFSERDSRGDLQPVYRVRPIRQDGQPANLWKNTYVAPIERGILQS